jgi:uncharacterized membrane protein YagU involved in acid resistance
VAVALSNLYKKIKIWQQAVAQLSVIVAFAFALYST